MQRRWLGERLARGTSLAPNGGVPRATHLVGMLCTAAVSAVAMGACQPALPDATADTVFADGFEGGTLSAWQDGVDPTRHRVLADPALAHSASGVLEVTYPAGSDGGWLTRFFRPGYDSLYVSYWVRFP